MITGSESEDSSEVAEPTDAGEELEGAASAPCRI